jgi:hypothetical protein
MPVCGLPNGSYSRGSNRFGFSVPYIYFICNWLEILENINKASVGVRVRENETLVCFRRHKFHRHYTVFEHAHRKHTVGEHCFVMCTSHNPTLCTCPITNCFYCSKFMFILLPSQRFTSCPSPSPVEHNG